MAGYTKADYDASYSIRAEREWGHPSTRTEIRIGYQYEAMKDYINPRWDAIVAHLGLTTSDIIVVAGGGFGWAVEHLKTLMPGINAVSVDISDYIDAEKDTSDSTELDKYITDGGLDPLTGRGAQIKAKYSRPGARSKSIILKEGMNNNGSRNRVRQALGNNIPTHIFTENMIQEFTDIEIMDWVNELDKLTNTVKIHIITNEIDRTAESIAALTGHRTLLVGDHVDKDIS